MVVRERAKNLSAIVRQLRGPSAATRRLPYLEAQLLTRGFSPGRVRFEDSTHFDELYKKIVIEMEGGKSIDLAVTGNLQGKIVTPVGLAGLTASLTYDSLNPEVYLFVLTSSHRLKPLAGLWLGDNNPQRLSTYERNLGVRLKASFQIFPKNPNSIPGWGIFRGEAPTFSGPDVSNWTYHSRIHSLDYIERLPHVEPEMLQLHRLAGPDFSYAVRLPYDEPPAEHHLVFQTGGLSKVEIFRRSVDALCRMIDYYEGKVDKPVIGQVAATPTLPRQ